MIEFGSVILVQEKSPRKKELDVSGAIERIETTEQADM
jgi:hypothetical protein